MTRSNHALTRLYIQHTAPAPDGLIGYCARLEPPDQGAIRFVVGYRLAHCVTPARLAALRDGLELARREHWRLVELVAPDWPTCVWITGYAPSLEDQIP